MSVIDSFLPFTAGQLKTYKDIALLFLKYGRDEMTRIPGVLEHFSEEELLVKKGQADDLAEDLEKMGPTFVKIGQLLSTRADLLQQPYLESLERLQDNVAPVDFQDLAPILEGELGIRISKAFSSFDETPLASASLGQVHRAQLRDGREVVVKIQRPQIRERVSNDLSALSSIADFLQEHTEMGERYNVSKMVEELRESILRELDYTLEARNLELFRTELDRFPKIVVPRTIPDLCSGRVLTMDYLQGNPVTSLSGVVLSEIDGSSLADELFHSYLYQILILGSFHADPHPGNVLITEDRRVGLIDLGMVGRVDELTRETLAHFLIALSEKKGRAVGNCAIRMGSPQEGFDRNEFLIAVSQLVSDEVEGNVGDMNIGQLVMRVTKLCADHHLRIPEAILLLGKTLLNLDLVADSLDSSYDPAAAIREKSTALLEEQVKEHFSLGTILTTARDFRDLVADLPSKTNQVLDLIAGNDLRISVETIDEKLLIRSFQKIANRITAGLIIASLVIGAAMMMNIESSWTLAGYPLFALILFSFAFVGGLILVWKILLTDD
ncbi:MAG: ABC1 kinase family protein [Verrucomicrobiaceae bacterium]